VVALVIEVIAKGEVKGAQSRRRRAERRAETASMIIGRLGEEKRSSGADGEMSKEVLKAGGEIEK